MSFYHCALGAGAGLQAGGLRLVEVDLKDTARAAAADALGPSPTSEPPLTKAAVKEEEAAGRLVNAEALAIVVEARASAADLAIFMLGKEVKTRREIKKSSACEKGPRATIER